MRFDFWRLRYAGLLFSFLSAQWLLESGNIRQYYSAVDVSGQVHEAKKMAIPFQLYPKITYCRKYFCKKDFLTVCIDHGSHISHLRCCFFRSLNACEYRFDRVHGGPFDRLRDGVFGYDSSIKTRNPVSSLH
jgi:hypothetical protein